MEDLSPDLFSGLDRYHDKPEILKAILVQLEKDTGLDYTSAPADPGSPEFLGMLRKDLAQHLKKISGQNQTRFMHLIYRVDISQSKLNKLEMDEFYFNELAELVLNRLFQKVITRRFFKP